jgi:uncharacterized protein with HEPN domain
MKRSYTEFLQDILDAIAEIELFMTGVSFHTFESNREKILAVVKLLYQIRFCYQSFCRGAMLAPEAV